MSAIVMGTHEICASLAHGLLMSLDAVSEDDDSNASWS